MPCKSFLQPDSRKKRQWKQPQSLAVDGTNYAHWLSAACGGIPSGECARNEKTNRMKSYWVFLLRNKSFTLIEILSLSTALGFLLIIGSFALRQFSITRETPSCKDIYFTGTQDVIGLSYGIAGPLSAEIPEIETLTRIMSFDLPVEAGNEKIQARVYATDKHFFQIFTNYRILAGSAEELDIADHILLSESFAKRIFPSEKQVIGKTLTLDGKALVVAGIVEDFRNTLFKETDISTF